MHSILPGVLPHHLISPSLRSHLYEYAHFHGDSYRHLTSDPSFILLFNVLLLNIFVIIIFITKIT